MIDVSPARPTTHKVVCLFRPKSYLGRSEAVAEPALANTLVLASPRRKETESRPSFVRLRSLQLHPKASPHLRAWRCTCSPGSLWSKAEAHGRPVPVRRCGGCTTGSRAPGKVPREAPGGGDDGPRGAQLEVGRRVRGEGRGGHAPWRSDHEPILPLCLSHRIRGVTKDPTVCALSFPRHALIILLSSPAALLHRCLQTMKDSSVMKNGEFNENTPFSRASPVPHPHQTSQLALSFLNEDNMPRAYIAAEL